MAETNLLQIVHVSDLHVCKLKDKAARLWIRNQLQKRNLLGREEGTRPYDETAAAAFGTFLAEWTKKDKTWFPDDRATLVAASLHSHPRNA